LLEPPHHAAPPRFEDSVFQVMANGYIPLITHPERLGWVGDHYQAFVALAHRGAWMQLTAGSLTGRFGPEARYWSERMLDEGLVHVLATDAHGVKHRSPLLAEGCRAAEKWVGAEEAERMVRERPQAVIENRDPASVPNPPGLSDDTAPRPLRRSKPAWLARLFG
jgi:protein-tyrosine phosphatase